MLLLALDTATVSVSVALHDGTDILAEIQGEGSMAHGEQLTPTIARVMAEAGMRPADLTDIAVGVGPGPYTGLRVGLVTALTLSNTLNIRAHGLCSLDPLGSSAQTELGLDSDFIAAIDARRKEVYWARFNANGERVSEPTVDRPAAVAELGLPVVGRGGLLHESVLDFIGGPLDPTASELARLVVAGKAQRLPLEPLYLRKPDAVPQPKPQFPRQAEAQTPTQTAAR